MEAGRTVALLTAGGLTEDADMLEGASFDIKRPPVTQGHAGPLHGTNGR